MVNCLISNFWATRLSLATQKFINSEAAICWLCLRHWIALLCSTFLSPLWLVNHLFYLFIYVCLFVCLCHATNVWWIKDVQINDETNTACPDSYKRLALLTYVLTLSVWWMGKEIGFCSSKNHPPEKIRRQIFGRTAVLAFYRNRYRRVIAVFFSCTVVGIRAPLCGRYTCAMRNRHSVFDVRVSIRRIFGMAWPLSLGPRVSSCLRRPPTVITYHAADGRRCYGPVF